MANIKLLYKDGKQKALTLSYDDGVDEDIQLISIMNKYGLKGTFNLNSGCFSPEGTVFEPGRVHRPMTEKQVKELYVKNGMEVALHGLTHPSLPALPVNRMTYEIIEDRKNLENLFGVLVRGAAYPYGTYNDTVVQTLANSGICYCRTVNSTHNFGIPGDWLRLNPTCHHDDPMLMELTDRFVNEKDYRVDSALFYLWGHSYEFEQHDNWKLIEDFAQKVSGKDDIWYATNIEVYDYCQAFGSLLFNVDMTMCQNPTAITVWFKYRDISYKVEPGQTIRL